QVALGASVKVLVCDDHQLLAEALATVLRGRGDTVILAGSPREALLAAREHATDVCLMAGSFRKGDDTIEAARRILAVSPSTRVIMLTGDVDAATVRRALDAGVRGVLRKSNGLRTILESFDKVVAGSVVVVPAPRRAVPAFAAPRMAVLTPREREALERLVRGESTHAIAAGMGVSYSTARTHTHSMMTKLGVQSRLEAAAFAIEHGLVPQEAGPMADTGA
ncbi:MAG: response regulator transcription factor, partial [Mycobacteriales bacterium]